MSGHVRVALGEGLESLETRPHIPGMLKLALTAWASCAVVFSLLRHVACMLSADVAIISSAACSVISALCAISLVRYGREALLWSSGLALGVALAFAGLSAYAIDVDEAGDLRVVNLRLIEDARDTEYGATALCEATGDGGDGVVVTAYLPEGGEVLLRGSYLNACADVSFREGEPSDYAWTRGEVGTVRVAEITRGSSLSFLEPVYMLRERAIGELGMRSGSQAGLLQALACGYTRTMEETGLYEACKITGLAHLVAVSGSHLAIIAAFAQAVLLRVGVPAVLRGVVIVIFMVAYLAFSGMAVSAIRSAIMASVGALCVFGGRRSSSINSAGICALAFLAFDPKSCLSASLVLSAGSTLGIILFSSLFASWLPFSRGRFSFAGEAASMTIAASIVTLPYSAALFSQLPLVTLASNIAAAPLFAPACILSLAASVISVAMPFMADGVILLAFAPCWALEGLIRLFAAIPYACVPVSLPVPVALSISTAASYVLWRTWPRPRFECLASCLAIGCAAAAVIGLTFGFIGARSTQLIALDVGQGDAYLVRSGGDCLLIDTGTNDSLLRESLARNGVYRLDAVLITHGDDDHCGSLEALASVVKVDRVLLSSGVRECACASCASLLDRAGALRGEPSIELLEVSDVITCGNIDLEVLWPAQFSDDGGNADSLCLLANVQLGRGDGQVGSWTALFTGDLEAEELLKVASGRDLGEVDVLKVGHHGSEGSISPALAQMLAPSIALIGVGEGNRYGHPHPDALSALDEAGALVMRTDLHGDVRLDFYHGEIRVTCERDAPSVTMKP